MGTITSRRLFLSTAGVLASIPTLPTRAAPSPIDGQGETRVLKLDAEEDLSVPERQVLEINRRTQRQNNAPPDFPSFIREGYDMTILTSEGYQVRLLYRINKFPYWKVKPNTENSTIYILVAGVPGRHNL